MERTYTVKAGDTLSQIALKFGLGPDGYAQITAHAENQPLFGDNSRNEFRINPGDKLVIPAIAASQHSVETNKKITFKTQSRKGFISLKPLDVHGEPLDTFRYEIIIGDLEEEGDESTNSGLIQVALPSRLDKPLTKSENKDAKSEGRIVKYWPNNLTDSERDSKSPEELKEHSKGIVKLFANPKDDDEFQILNINVGFESKNDVIGKKKQLANELKYFGSVNSDTGAQSCKIEDEVVHQMMSDEVDHVASLPPMTSTVNLRPDYYPLVWEFLRYGRILEIAKSKYEELDEELTEAKENNDSFSIMELFSDKEENEAYDALAIRTEKARMDVAYYQYCFIRWLKEFELVWGAHQPSFNPVEVILQSRQHGAMEESLQQLVEDWSDDFSSIDDIKPLLDLKFEAVPYPPQEYDVYSPIYNTQHVKDQLSTHTVSVPMTSRVRFCYKGETDQVIANSYVIYWRYDKSGNDIEKGREAYYEKASIMMPVGIGKTDGEGYLVQSIPFSDLYHNGFMHVKDNKFAMQSGWGFKDGKIDDSFVPSDEDYTGLVDLQDEVKSLTIPEGPWDEMVARVNKNFPEYSEGGDFDWRHISIGSSMHTNAVESSENYAELHESLEELRKEFPNHYRELRTTSSNHLFNHYSSGQQDTYGFMVYPPDGGLFQTADLANLGTDGQFAYKGPVNAPNDQKNPIELHCTLQEWERRLRVLNVGIKKDIESYSISTSSHRENIVNVDRMGSLLDIHNRYPYEKVSPGAMGEKNKLADSVKKLNEGIRDRLLNPDAKSDEDAYAALSSMRIYSDKIVKIFLSEKFKEEYILHRDAVINESASPSPYMQVNETWRSIYSTIADSLELLGATPWADEICDDVVNHPFDAMARTPGITKMMEGWESIFPDEDASDAIIVDNAGNDFNETKIFFEERYEEKLKIKDEEPKTILAEILANEEYQTAKFVKKNLDALVNKNPGPSSVLMVVLDTYGAFLHKKMIADKDVAGFHIRILIATYRSFGLFSGEKSLDKVTLLKILRTNKTLRGEARRRVSSKLLADFSDPLKKWKHSARVNRRAQVRFLEAKEKAKRMGNRKSLARLKREEEALSGEVYTEAKGRAANVYKTALHLMSIVQLAEDIQKASRISQQQHVDPDIVFMYWAKTGTDSIVISANTMLLANRWIEGMRQSGGFLDDAGKFSSKMIGRIANKVAIFGGIISLYITARETASLWGHKNDLEKFDACIGMLSESLLLVGAFATTEFGAAFLGRFALLAFIPGLAPFLMIAGAVLVLVQIGVGAYQYYETKNYLETHPVGFYFWQEFKELQDSGQAYYDKKYIRSGSQEAKGYEEILAFQNNFHEYLGQEQPGWGHLSWRAAVPLFNKWRKRKASDEKLIESIAQMIEVPHEHAETKQTSVNIMVKAEDVTHLLSAESFIRFYNYIESIIMSDSKSVPVFKCSNKAYHTIMSELENGKYVPQGETDEVIEVFKQLEIRGCAEFDKDDWLNFLPKSTEITSLYTHWDHPHFRLPASDKGLVTI